MHLTSTINNTLLKQSLGYSNSDSLIEKSLWATGGWKTPPWAAHVTFITVRQEHRSTASKAEKRRDFNIFLVEVGEKSGTNRRNITNWESWLRKRLKKGESVRKVKPCASVCDPSMPRSHHVCNLQQPICMFVCLISFVCSFQFLPISIYKIWKSKMKCIEGKPVHSVCLEIISESNWDLFYS